VQMVGACECSNGPSSYIKCGEFLGYLNIYFKRGSVPWSKLGIVCVYAYM